MEKSEKSEIFFDEITPLIEFSLKKSEPTLDFEGKKPSQKEISIVLSDSLLRIRKSLKYVGFNLLQNNGITKFVAIIIHLQEDQLIRKFRRQSISSFCECLASYREIIPYVIRTDWQRSCHSFWRAFIALFKPMGASMMKYTYLFRLERGPIFIFAMLSIPSLILNGRSAIGIAIFGTILFHWLLWNQSYFVIGATLVQLLVNSCRARNPQAKTVGFFNEMFQDEDLLKLFVEHSSHEWSIENPLIKRDIIKYKSLTSEPERRQFANTIISKYLSGSESVMELNISHQQREPCVSRFKNEGYCGSDLFDGVEEVVTQNLFDIWNRFKFSKEYKAHLTSLKAKNMMIENK